MIIISTSSPSSVLSLSSISYKRINGSIPRGLYPGGDFLKSFDVETFAKILLLMVLATFGFLNFLTQVNFQSDEWQ